MQSDAGRKGKTQLSLGSVITERPGSIPGGCEPINAGCNAGCVGRQYRWVIRGAHLNLTVVKHGLHLKLLKNTTMAQSAVLFVPPLKVSERQTSVRAARRAHGGFGSAEPRRARCPA